MEPATIGLLTAGLFVLLLVLGMHIAFAGFLSGFLGLWLLRDFGVAATILGIFPHAQSASYGLSVIPLFILMGYFAHQGGLTVPIYNAVRAWLGHLRWGLAISTTYGCALLGAISGASTAAVAIFAKIAIPQMDHYGYHRRLSAGAVAASGTLASLIPPSALVVIYGILAEQSIGKLLIAGILPGFLSATIYAVMIYVRVRLNPSLARSLPAIPIRERFTALKGIIVVPLIFVVVLGGLYLGVFTPTEAGAAGALSILLLTIIMRRMTWSGFKQAFLDTGQTTVMIFLIIVGVMMFMRVLALSGLSIAFVDFMVALPVPNMGILLGLLALYGVLGMFLTATSMLILAVPLTVPVVLSLGYDPIWFGILVIKMVEVCLITPPVGLNVYVCAGVLGDTPVEEIFRGAIPFFLMDITTIALLIVFPQITLFLPSLMR